MGVKESSAGLEDTVNICGTEYSVGLFEDQGEIKQFPYIHIFGRNIPIIRAASVIIEKDEKYFLVKEADKGLGFRNDEGTLNFPGGMVEEGETFLDGAVREALEETPFEQVELTDFLGVFWRLNPRGKATFTALFSAKATGNDLNKRLASDVRGGDFYSKEEIISLEDKGRLKTDSVMYYLQAYQSGRIYRFDMINSPNVLTELPSSKRKEIAYAVAINQRQGDVLLRYDPDTNQWCFPGGIIESGSGDLADDLEKKAREQTGHLVEVYRLPVREFLRFGNTEIHFSPNAPIEIGTSFFEENDDSYMEKLYLIRRFNRRPIISSGNGYTEWVLLSQLKNLNLHPSIKSFFDKYMTTENEWKLYNTTPTDNQFNAYFSFAMQHHPGQ